MCRFKFTWVTALLIGSTASVQGTVITLDASSRGYISSTGGGNSPTAESTYFAGVGEFSEEFRNYFAFDIPTLPGQVVAARLILHSGGFISAQGTETYELTSIPNGFGFGDLGKGTTYGSRAYTSADAFFVRDVVLNGAAIADIAASSTFRIGGRLTTVDGLRGQAEEVFAGTGTSGAFYPTQLELTFGGDVPEPATWLMFGVGLGVVAVWQRRRAGGAIR